MPGIAQALHQRDQRLGLDIVQARGRLVEDQKARIAFHRAQDFADLLLAGRQLAQNLPRVERQAEQAEQLAGAAVHPGEVDPAAFARQAADEDVFRDRHVGKDRKFLMDHGDVALRPVPGRGCATGNAQLALVRFDLAIDDLQGGALAGAVLAQDGVNFPSGDGKADIVQRLDGAIALADPDEAQNGFGAHYPTSRKCGHHRRWKGPRALSRTFLGLNRWAGWRA